MRLDEDMAELVGAIIGDGHIHIDKKKYQYQLLLFGNGTEDYEYLKYLDKLIIKLFSLKMNFRFHTKENLVRISKNSKNMVLFLRKEFQILSNKTKNCHIPKKIMLTKNRKIQQKFLRGIADTDFSLTFKKRTYKSHKYPVIRADFKSKSLVQDIVKILARLGFSYNVRYQRGQFNKRSKKIEYKNEIYICGKKNLLKWIQEIGFSNIKHLTKYLLWKKFDHCPPYTTLLERKKVLNKKEDISKIGKKPTIFK